MRLFVALFCALIAFLTPVRAKTVTITLQYSGAKHAAISSEDLRLRYTAKPYAAFDQAKEAVRAAPRLPLWSRKVTSMGDEYTYTMVGKNPFWAGATATNITTWLIPVKVTFQPQNIVFDPSVPEPCATGRSVIDLVRESPLFAYANYRIGKTNVGGGLSQFANAFQRANYWRILANRTGYKINLVPQSALSLNIVANDFPDPVAVSCGKVGLLNFNAWDQVAQTFIRNNPSYIKPNHFPLFVFGNVVMFGGIPSNCCIAGYHAAFPNPAYAEAMQTHATGTFLTNDALGPANRDIAILSHEVIDWLANPSGTNPTPSWGHIGQVTGCRGILETGDPLTGTSFIKTMPNGFSYHLQDEAFTSWFYRQSPSTGAAGRYSFRGTFTTHAGGICSP